MRKCRCEPAGKVKSDLSGGGIDALSVDSPRRECEKNRRSHGMVPGERLASTPLVAARGWSRNVAAVSMTNPALQRAGAAASDLKRDHIGAAVRETPAGFERLPCGRSVSVDAAFPLSMGGVG